MRALLLGLAAVLALPLAAQPVWYVNADASGAGTGASWDDAFTDLQSALAAAEAGEEVWVAEGTYHPTSGTDRSASFALPDGVRLFGGFDGTEAERHERDWAQHETVLSGDLGAPGQAGDNSFHVVRAEGVDAATLLDGFVVRDGYADGQGAHDRGGGLYNQGGGPTLRNLRIEHNYAAGVGGGIYNEFALDHTLLNVQFVMNEAALAGAVASDLDSRPTFIHATFSGNKGGVLLARNVSRVTLLNAIVWANEGPSYILESGGTVEGSHVISAEGFSANPVLYEDPEFVRNPFTYGPTDPGDLRLRPTSPAIDFGDTAWLPPDRDDEDADGSTTEWYPFDLLHEMRLRGGAPDPGMAEGGADTSPPCPPNARVYVDADATGQHTGESWADAYTTLQAGLDRVVACSPATIWLAEGTYVPTFSEDRTALFRLDLSLRLLGGFSGVETSEEERDPAAHPTILSGEIGAPGPDDNSYRLVEVTGGSAVLDGLIIQDAYREQGSGAGLAMLGDARVTIRNCVFARNQAEGGGAILRGYGDALTIEHSTFRNNKATGIYGGGAIYASGPDSLVVEESTFTGNTARHGGALYVTAPARLSYNTFEENHTSVTTYAGTGGAVHVDRPEPSQTRATRIEHSVFRGNTAGSAEEGGRGGALFCHGYCAIRETVFEQNEAFHGGGAYASPGGYSSFPYGSVTLATSSFLENRAHQGGGLYLEAFAPVEHAELDRLTFTRNEATEAGGGAYLFQPCGETLHVYNLLAEGNRADLGGGLYVTGGLPPPPPDIPGGGPGPCSARTLLADLALVGNTATSLGGGLYVGTPYQHAVAVSSLTLTENEGANGAGVFVSGAVVTLSNSVLWLNQGDEIDYDTTGTPRPLVRTSLIEGGFEGGSSILDEDPLFTRAPHPGTDGAWGTADDDYGNLRLQTASPAIDFGNLAYFPADVFDFDDDGDPSEPIPYDLAGGVRVAQTGLDLGAYESQLGVAVEPPGALPAAFRLLGAYPNPFNPATRVAFDLPEAAEVALAVFDVLGRRVAEVGPVPLAAGAGQSLVLDGRGLASGLYLYRLTARMGETTRTAAGRITLLK